MTLCMTNLSLKHGKLLCQILFSSLIVLDILAAANTIFPTLETILDQGVEGNGTDSDLNVTLESTVDGSDSGYNITPGYIVVGMAEIAALAILILCNVIAIRWTISDILYD